MKEAAPSADGIEVDMDEVECILANLIYSGKVKGYISHQKSILVLSKQDPFPISAIITKPNNVQHIFSFSK